MRLCFALTSFLLVLTASAQSQAALGTQPSVTFKFDWNQGIPWQTYSITVGEDGSTHFQGIPATEELKGDTDLYQQDFTMSEANRVRIFSLARKLNYFQGDFDSHLKKIAQTGSKTLKYESPNVHGLTAYNWSQNADVEELTRIFLAIANTLDFGRKLAFQYRFDKLGMNTRLEELQNLTASHNAEELNAIASILQKIADDPNMMNISRQTAQQLLRPLKVSGQSNETPAQP
jgi:hypothetical protein